MEINRSVADRSDSILLVMDRQERLARAMPGDVRDRVVGQVSILLAATVKLAIPVVVTEQYPQGLGYTEKDLIQRLPVDTPIIEKTVFSAAKVERMQAVLQHSQCKQVILVGMETHICILQTALELLKQGYQVYVVEDAVSSRAKANQYNALQRLRLAGAIITNVESLLFEWLADANHPEFKTLSRLIL